MNVAIIPARGGSQRIPRKNIKQFCGRSMISYPIEAAIKSNYIDSVVVSTDDEEIAQISTQFGAQIPFMRPKNISDNITPTVPVISHAITKLLDMGWEIDKACCIYPCTPLLTSHLIDNIFDEMIKGDHMFAYPVILHSHPIQRAMKMKKDGKMDFLNKEHELTRTQDLEPTFYDSGQFYWGQKKAWLNKQKMHTDGIGVQINSWEAVDIDNDEDWEKAEMLIKSINK